MNETVYTAWAKTSCIMMCYDFYSLLFGKTLMYLDH